MCSCQTKFKWELSKQGDAFLLKRALVVGVKSFTPEHHQIARPRADDHRPISVRQYLRVNKFDGEGLVLIACGKRSL